MFHTLGKCRENFCISAFLPFLSVCSTLLQVTGVSSFKPVVYQKLRNTQPSSDIDKVDE